MEDLTSIILPDMSGKKEKPKKPNKTVLVEKQTLPRVNRTVNCKYCEIDKILNPDQYQLLFDLYENEDKLKQEFMCKPCEMMMKKNPIEFWAIHGEQLQTLCKNIKESFDTFRRSGGTTADVVNMQNTCVSHLNDCKITSPNFEFIVQNSIPVALKINNFPFVGSIVLEVYEQRKNRIHIGR